MTIEMEKLFDKNFKELDNPPKLKTNSSVKNLEMIVLELKR